jgi:hypothetical protein
MYYNVLHRHWDGKFARLSFPHQMGSIPFTARKSHATFDAAGAGNLMMAAGLRATAKALEHPPEPNVGAPVLDPTANGKKGCIQRRMVVGLSDFSNNSGRAAA